MFISCAKELDSEGKDYFRAALQNITNSSSTLTHDDKDVQKSDLITLLFTHTHTHFRTSLFHPFPTAYCMQVGYNIDNINIFLLPKFITL